MISNYHNSLIKRVLDVAVSIFFILTTVPISLLIVLLVILTSGWPVFFIHKRNGKNGKVIDVIKFRSMVNGAESMQKKYSKLNESDGPTFKIKDDPRFTKFGRILSRTGLDELPQFVNVIKGDMSIVGPRPLPVSEARKLSPSEKIRELVNPGITSSWVINGAHEMSFKKWMEFDAQYVKNASFFTDISVIVKTLLITISSILNL